MGRLNKKELGSKTAKGGFKNEELITSKFNNYLKDKDAKNWLKIMGYDYKKIHKLIRNYNLKFHQTNFLRWDNAKSNIG